MLSGGPPLRSKDAADSYQKTAQSEGFDSSLASFSTGAMSASSLQELLKTASSQSCCIPLDCQSGGKVTATVGGTFSTGGNESGEKASAKISSAISPGKDPFPPDPFGCGKGNDLEFEWSGAKGPSVDSCWLNKRTYALGCAVTISMTICMASMVFSALMYGEMMDQREMIHTLLQNSRSLQQKYDTLHDDDQPLINDNQLLEDVLTADAHGGDDEYNVTTDLKANLRDGVMQLLRTKALGKSEHESVRKRVKRNGHIQIIAFVRQTVSNILQQRPKVHLKGLHSDPASRPEGARDDGYLVWQPDRDSFVHRSVTLKHVHNHHNWVKALEIQQSGIYLVYSQVIVNGSRTGSPSWGRDCAHQTVTVPFHDDTNPNNPAPVPKVLMSAFLTQDAEGRYSNHSIPLPRDSSLQMGIFRLIRQDQVRVRIPPNEDCRSTIFTTSFDSSYFGLYRIA